MLSVGADCTVCIVSLLQQTALRVFSGVRLAGEPTIWSSRGCINPRLFAQIGHDHDCCLTTVDCCVRHVGTAHGSAADELMWHCVLDAGHPSVPTSAAWDPVRGYLACLCQNPEDVSSSTAGSANAARPSSSSAVAFVWDVHSGMHYMPTHRAYSVVGLAMVQASYPTHRTCAFVGGQDRTASGAAAVEIFRHLDSAARATHQHGTVTALSSSRCFAEPVISAHGGVVVLDIDVSQLLSMANGSRGELVAKSLPCGPLAIKRL